MAVATLNTVFDLKDLFTSIFGYTPAHVPSMPDAGPSGDLPQIGAATIKTESIYGEPLYGSADMLGYEVFCPVTIEVDGVDFDFPYTVVGIRRSKTIIETEMTELNGSVKEIIGNRDFDITIKGFLIGQYGQFPDDKLKMLNDVFEYNQTVRLKSAYSDIFLHSNDYVVIKELQIPEKPKVIGVRDFSFQMVSDNIFTLYQS